MKDMIDKSDTELGMLDSSKCLVTGVICVILAVAGCHKRPVAVAPPPQVTAPVIIRVDAPVPVYLPIPTSLDVYASPPVPGAVEREQADSAFTAGRYEEAIQAYENLLLISPSGDGRDEALFRLGLSCVLRKSGEPDWQRARTVLKQLVNDYPDSPLKLPAVVILTLRSQANDLVGEIKAREQATRRLSLELERLKQIDAERGRRP
jgi:tetratricopeptide (TPR) repeat protein